MINKEEKRFLSRVTFNMFHTQYHNPKNYVSIRSVQDLINNFQSEITSEQHRKKK